jgi:hypothetical protein
MRQTVTHNRDRVAVVTEDRTLTFAEAWAGVFGWRMLDWGEGGQQPVLFCVRGHRLQDDPGGRDQL